MTTGISRSAIAKVVHQDLVNHFNMPRPLGAHTIGEWSGFDVKSVRLKSVTIGTTHTALYGENVKSTVRDYTAVFDVLKTRGEYKGQYVEVRVQNVINLAKNIGQWDSRTGSRLQRRAIDTSYANWRTDRSTVSWID